MVDFSKLEGARQAVEKTLKRVYIKSKYPFNGKSILTNTLISETLSQKNIEAILGKLERREVLDRSVYFYNDSKGESNQYKSSDYDQQLIERLFVLYAALVEVQAHYPDDPKIQKTANHLAQEVLLPLSSLKAGWFGLVKSIGDFIGGKVGVILENVEALCELELPEVAIPLQATVELFTGLQIAHARYPRFCDKLTSEQVKLLAEIKERIQQLADMQGEAKQVDSEQCVVLVDDRAPSEVKPLKPKASEGRLVKLIQALDLSSMAPEHREKIQADLLAKAQYLDESDEFESTDSDSDDDTVFYDAFESLEEAEQFVMPQSPKQSTPQNLEEPAKLEDVHLPELSSSQNEATPGSTDGPLSFFKSAYNAITSIWANPDYDKLKRYAKQESLSLDDRIDICKTIKNILTEVYNKASEGVAPESGRKLVLNNWIQSVDGYLKNYEDLQAISTEDRQVVEMAKIDNKILNSANAAVEQVRNYVYSKAGPEHSFSVKVTRLLESIAYWFKTVFHKSTLHESCKLSDHLKKIGIFRPIPGRCGDSVVEQKDQLPIIASAC